MSPHETEQNQTSLPLLADPSAGALIGTFLLALCLGGPVGLVLVLVVWIAVEAVKRALARREPDSDAKLSSRSPKG
jgi:hypothetical protein